MGHRVRIDPYLWILLPAALLMLPLPWIAAAVCAAVFHEICHYLAIRLCRQKVHALYIGVSGASMQVSQMSRGKEALCAAAGPAGSLLLVCLARWVPEIAVCGLVHGLFNLIPLYPLDGGRLLRCVCSARVYRLVTCTTVSAVIVFMVWMAQYSIVPFLAAGICAIRLLVRKRPCKDRRLRVQ